MLPMNHVFEDEDGAPYPEEVQRAAKVVLGRMSSCIQPKCYSCERALQSVVDLLVIMDKSIRQYLKENPDA